MKNNLLLINPPIYDFTAYNLWARPLGLLYIASLLKSIGFNVDYIDCLSLDHEKSQTDRNAKTKKSREKKFSTYHYFKEEVEKPDIYKSMKRKYYRFGISKELLKELAQGKNKPDAVLATSIMTYWYKGVFEVIRCIKEIYPNVPVILGGIYAILCSEHAESFSAADYIFKSNEVSKLVELLSGIFKDEKFLARYNSIFRDKNPILSSYPALDFYKKNNFIPLLTSLGCKYKCKYCASKAISNYFVERPYQDVINEIEYWQNKYNVKDVAFYDDALLQNKEGRFIPLLKEIVNKNFNLNFHTPNGLHIKLLDKKTAILMREAGFKSIRFGFESSIKRFQEDSSYKVSNEDFDRAMRILNEAGFTRDDIGIYILMGLPSQKPEDIIDTIKLVKSYGVKPKLCEYSPTPHTKHFYQSQHMTDKNLEEPLYQNNTALQLWSKNFSESVIAELKNMVKL